MKIFLLVLAIFCIISHSTASFSESFSCLNPTNVNFFQVCNLAFFPASTNITGNVTLAGSHDVLIQATFPSLNVSQLVNSYLSPSLKSLARLVKLDTFSIQNPVLQINVGATQAVHFSGVVSLFSLTGLQVDVLAMKTIPPSLLLGLSLPFSSLPIVLNSFFPINVASLTSVFNSDSSLSLVVTNGFDFENIPELEPYYLTKINSWESPAVTVYASVALTKGSNLVSTFLRKYLGEDATLLMAMSVDKDSMTAFVGIKNIPISSKLLLSSAGVSVKLGRTKPNPEFSIEASMELTVSDYALVFNGAMTFTPVDLTLAFSMENIWINAFGLKRLSFGNLLLSGSLSYAGIPSAFSVGAEIAIGLECYQEQIFQGNGFCLQGKGYVGIDVAKPENNFFYLQLSALSFDVFLRALLGSKDAQKVVVPSILNSALQFPNGITASYSLSDQSLPNLELKAGYVFKGTISIFKASATIDVAYYINDFKFKALIYATPINLGGVFTLTGNSSSNGPYLNIDVGIFPVPVFKVQVYASVTLLGISASVQITIGIEKLSFFIAGPILYGALYGDFAVKITNNNFQSGNFMVAANLRMNQAMLDLIAFIANAVSGAMTAAKNEVDKGQNSVTKAQYDVLAQKAKVCADIDAQCRKSQCSATTNQCSLYGQKTVCSQTAKQCSGGWRDTCTSTAQSCTSKLPGWLSWACGAWATVCTATSKVCGAWSTVCTVSAQVTDYTVCQVSKEVCTAYNWVVDTSCKAACGTAKAGLDTANAAMFVANQVMEGVEISFGGLAKAFDFIASKTTTIFNIIDAGFTFNMNAGNKASFNVGISVRMNVIILGKTYERYVIFSFSDLDAIKKALVDDVLKQVKSAFQ